MAVSKAKKLSILKQLQDRAAAQKAIILLTTKGAKESIDADSNFKIRSAARKEGAVLQITKNTLISQLGKGFDSLERITGQTYVAFLEDSEKAIDEVTLPKIIVKVTKEYADKINILGAIVNGEYIDASQTKVLSDTPTFPESMSTLAGMLNQITAKIAIGVKEVPASIARGVNAASEKLPQA